MKKVLGIFLLFTLLLSAGTIYASGNSGQRISDWYQDLFRKESVKLVATTATGITVVYKELNTFLEKSKEDIETSIASFGEKKVQDAKTGIEDYQNQTVKNLDDSVAELEKENFDDYVDKLNIEAEISQDLEIILNEVFSE